MRLFGPVDAINKLCRHEVAQVLHTIRGSVYVVVATFSVVAEAVGVLHTQVQALKTQQPSGHYKEAYFAKGGDETIKRSAFMYLMQMGMCLLYLQGLWIRALTGR